MKRHGWFAIPGYQTGDRTLDEQIAGCEDGLAAARGKTIIDLGCAEGLISRRFLEAGACSLVGLDHSEEKIKTARMICKDFQNAMFLPTDLMSWFKSHGKFQYQYDIVLALSIITKFPDPAVILRYAADSCADLLLLRTSAKPCDGWYYAKHGGKACNVIDVLTERGFTAIKQVPGTHDEGVWYWRRNQ